MSIEDYFDPYSYDDRDPENEQRSEKKCKFCGKGNLEWEDDNGKWILIDSNSGLIHRCIKPKKIDIDKLLNTKAKP
jgi:hypothetical protein